MKKRRIRYSELAPTPDGGGAPIAPAQAPAWAPEPEPGPSSAPAVVTRRQRISTPVELARALAADRALEAPPAPLDGGAKPPHDQLFRSMRERARSRSGIVELLMFRAGDERFAVELRAVEEVIDLPVIHHVPEMPQAMLGVVTVRDTLTPVYSPHEALGLPLALRQAALIFRRGRLRVGILIDDVDDAISIDLAQLRDAPGDDQIDSVTLGVVRHGDSLVSLIDADALIAACQTAAFLEMA